MSYLAVIAPSLSLDIISKDNIEKAVHFFESRCGLKVKFMPNCRDNASIQARLDDLHAAFSDPSVKAIFTVIGGFSANELLPFIDYELIRRNKKIFCGFSDITVLANAITFMTGMVTFSGPHFSTMAMQLGNLVTEEAVCNLLNFENNFENVKITLTPCEFYRDDPWYIDNTANDQSVLIPNPGHVVINRGSTARGKLCGGNLAAFSLLRGTEYYIPDSELDTIILFFEWCDEYKANLEIFTQQMHAVMQSIGKNRCVGLLIGRFERSSGITMDHLSDLTHNLIRCEYIKPDCPVIANLDFGHTYPMYIMPIGGDCEITASGDIIVSHDAF